MKIHALAKINLGLRIINKRTDGYHNIETIFHPINLYDEITLEQNNTIKISSSNTHLPTNNKNLCWKAVELLQQSLKISQGVKIHIQKNIPVGAGLGGGSSNAAAMLYFLPKLWNVPIEKNILLPLALQLGSDVPYFVELYEALEKKSNLTSGYAERRGEKITMFSLQLPYWIVLVNPNIHISTPWAYQQYSLHHLEKMPSQKTMFDISKNTITPLSTILYNDFEKVVLPAHPKIAEIKNTFFSFGAEYSLMSGSGSSIYGLFKNENDAKTAIEHYRKEYVVSLTEPNC